MGKMQDVSFANLDQFLDYLPEDQKEMVDLLRPIFIEALPGCKEKLSFNVPFYGRNKNISYIWPGAVPWGKKRPPGVSIGFIQGYLLPDEEEYLDKGNRKFVRTKTFLQPNDIDEEILRFFLSEALEIDRRSDKKKKK